MDIPSFYLDWECFKQSPSTNDYRHLNNAGFAARAIDGTQG
ncbi:hypothetical protein N9T35_00535 [bacterium]|nr:hypothetical protein [bacterium]